MLPEGWVKPRGASQRHFFNAGVSNSLCSRWIALRHRGGKDAMIASLNDCQVCNEELKAQMKVLKATDKAVRNHPHRIMEHKQMADDTSGQISGLDISLDDFERPD